MKRWCEIFADESGRLRVKFFEHWPTRGFYSDYTSPLPVPLCVELSYAECGPFGPRSGSIQALRVVN